MKYLKIIAILLTLLLLYFCIKNLIEKDFEASIRYAIMIICNSYVIKTVKEE